MGPRLAVLGGALCTRETASTQVRLALQFCLCFRIRSREMKEKSSVVMGRDLALPLFFVLSPIFPTTYHYF